MLHSAGIICYRIENDIWEVFMCHSTGNYPYWSFPKGLLEEGESAVDAACREFKEETSFDVPVAETYWPLGTVQQTAIKKVTAFAVWNPSLDPSLCYCNTIEFPEGSGIIIPEIDAYKWVSLDEAFKIINPAQIPLLKEMMQLKEQYE